VLARRSVADAERVATSIVTLVEARAALARRRHAGDLAPADHRRAVADLADDWERWVRLEVSEPLTREAAGLAERHRLRGYDAIHLASALLLAARVGEPIMLASWDDALDAAAAREGLTVLRRRRR